MRTPIRGLAALLVLAAAAPSLAGDDGRFTLPAPSIRIQPEEPEPSLADAAPTIPGYADKGSEWITISGLLAHDFSDSTDVGLRVGWSHFLVNDVEFMLEANLWYFSQEGDDAAGINPAFAFRWHFVHEDRLSVYTELGIGMLFATNAVPDGGTDVDFTPRAGVGLTWQLSPDAPARLDAGIRWHHISNARITGDAKNPARDAPLLYAGLVFPF
jgi:hypothetical protein